MEYFEITLRTSAFKINRKIRSSEDLDKALADLEQRMEANLVCNGGGGYGDMSVKMYSENEAGGTDIGYATFTHEQRVNALQQIRKMSEPLLEDLDAEKFKLRIADFQARKKTFLNKNDIQEMATLEETISQRTFASLEIIKKHAKDAFKMVVPGKSCVVTMRMLSRIMTEVDEATAELGVYTEAFSDLLYHPEELKQAA